MHAHVGWRVVLAIPQDKCYAPPRVSKSYTKTGSSEKDDTFPIFSPSRANTDPTG